jgi:hypothetical protein
MSDKAAHLAAMRLRVGDVEGAKKVLRDYLKHQEAISTAVRNNEPMPQEPQQEWPHTITKPTAQLMLDVGVLFEQVGTGKCCRLSS